jgi:hypothetical protein
MFEITEMGTNQNITHNDTGDTILQNLKEDNT